METDLVALSRAIGNLESSVTTLFHRQEETIMAVKQLETTLKKKVWRDSAKVIGGAFAGGFTAVLVKIGIWGGENDDSI